MKITKSNRDILDSLCYKIKDTGKEVFVKNGNKIPEVYYVGRRKTGSFSLSLGLQDKTTAHWHDESWWEKTYETTLLSENNLCIYDLILHIGRKYNFKPLIIESCREPVARTLSFVAHVHQLALDIKSYSDFIKCLNHKNDFSLEIRPYSLRWKDYFGVDLVKDFNKEKNYLFAEFDNVKLLFLKLRLVVLRQSML